MDRFSFGQLIDEPNDNLKDATKDKAHRIRYPLPTIRKVLKLSPASDVGIVELMGAVLTYEASGAAVYRRELVHSEDLRNRGDRLVVDLPHDVSTVILDRDGSPFRQVDLGRDDDPDPYGLHTFISQIEIPYDVDLVRVDSGPGFPDVTFKAIHPPASGTENG